MIYRVRIVDSSGVYTAYETTKKDKAYSYVRKNRDVLMHNATYYIECVDNSKVSAHDRFLNIWERRLK